MKRADDFRSFVSERRMADESIAYMPELPDGCSFDYIDAIEETCPIADNPYEESTLRDTGLKIWDSVYIPLPKSVSLEPKISNTPLRSINKAWDSIKESLGMLGRPDGVHYVRPKGEFILDIMNDDIRILQGAHVLTHRETSCLEDDYTFGQLSDIFLRNIIKIFVARKYGLLINTHPENVNEDSFERYGIALFGSTKLRSPTLLAASSGPQCRINTDKTVVAILGSVGIEASPKNASEETSWKEINKWSSLPTIVALAGWECVDYITHSERAELSGTSFYAVPVPDLQEMRSFGDFLCLAKEKRGHVEESSEVMTIENWFASKDFSRGLSYTPQLPCPMCLRINQASPGIIKRPRSRKPKKPFAEAQKSSIPEIVEWCNYVTFMRNCISIGRTATAYALGSVTAVARRNANFKKRLDKIRKIKTLQGKYIRKASSGFISEAEQIQSKIEQLKKEIKE